MDTFKSLLTGQHQHRYILSEIDKLHESNSPRDKYIKKIVQICDYAEEGPRELLIDYIIHKMNNPRKKRRNVNVGRIKNWMDGHEKRGEKKDEGEWTRKLL